MGRCGIRIAVGDWRSLSHALSHFIGRRGETISKRDELVDSGRLVIQLEKAQEKREEPVSTIRKGYSLVPCAVPRYLTTRRRRMED